MTSEDESRVRAVQQLVEKAAANGGTKWKLVLNKGDLMQGTGSGIVVSLLFVCCLSAVCLLFVCCLSAVCLPFVCYWPAVCLLFFCSL
jgi:hypothetical protein